MKKKMIKTPIRYPGGKSRALKHLDKYFPREISEIREPMCGGASVGLYLKQKHPNAHLWLNDKYFNLYCFWYSVRDNWVHMPSRLRQKKEACGDSVEKHRELFLRAKEGVNDKSASLLDRACYFFILNRCSYGGLTEVGGFSKTAALGRFTQSSISRLEGVSELLQGSTITNWDYEKVLRQKEGMLIDSPKVFVYLDPPYDILKTKSDHLYKHHHEFDHMRFWTEFAKCSYKTMITYNHSQELVDRFEAFRQVKWNLKYGLHHKKKEDGTLTGNSKDELLILNWEEQND